MNGRTLVKLWLWLVILGAAVLAGGAVVLIRHHNTDTDILGSIAVLGGLAILLTAIGLLIGRSRDD